MRAIDLGRCLLLVGALGPWCAWACSADSPLDPENAVDGGDEGGGGPDAEPLSDTGIDTGKDSGKDSGKDTGTDSGVVVLDTGIADAGVDSGAPVPGAACSPPGLVVTTSCGACGKHDTVCEATYKWSNYGPCTGQVPGGCAPGSTRSSACGKCGSKAEVCTNVCTWVAGACVEPPTAVCAPGETKYLTAGCVDVETYRKVSCEPLTCAFGPPAPLPCLPLVADVEVSGTVDDIVTFDSALTPLTDQLTRTNATVGTCPAVLSAILTSYSYLVIYNPNAQAAVIDVWADKQDLVLDPDIDTMMAIYKPPFPKTPAERIACFGKYNTTCSVSPCRTGQFSWPGLANADAPTINAGGTLVVYHAAVSAVQTTKFRLFVRTRTLL